MVPEATYTPFFRPGMPLSGIHPDTGRPDYSLVLTQVTQPNKEPPESLLCCCSLPGQSLPSCLPHIQELRILGEPPLPPPFSQEALRLRLKPVRAGEEREHGGYGGRALSGPLSSVCSDFPPCSCTSLPKGFLRNLSRSPSGPQWLTGVPVYTPQVG